MPKIDRAGVWMQIFNKFLFFQLSEYSTILLWNISNSQSMKKSKQLQMYIYFFFQTIQFTIEIA